ncbi:MAG: class I SAM-dependent methyltransferase [Leptospiraceae bacterium]|nr:class I SAM-dependent methyltransferase [Leptospiraceae bacterium]
MKILQTIRKVIRNAISPVWLLDRRMELSTQKILSKCVKNNSKWLDVGCGLKPFASSFNHASYTGIDVEVSGRSDDLKKPDKLFDGVNIPYKERQFDGILCKQVLEYVENLDSLLAECNRVLKTGGVFVVSVPFVYREHEQPHDFSRFTSFGLKQIFSHFYFQTKSSEKCLSAIETIATLFSVYVNNNIGVRNKFIFILTGCLITLPILVTSIFLSKILLDNKELFCVLVNHSVKIKNLKR